MDGLRQPSRRRSRQGRLIFPSFLHLVIWFFCLSSVRTPGGLMVPRGIRFTVTFTPSGFERFFQEIEQRRLLDRSSLRWLGIGS
jgi:hypothetical protein